MRGNRGGSAGSQLVALTAEDEEEVVVDENAPEAVKLLLRKKAEESIDEQYAVGWHRDATLGLRTTRAEDRPYAHRVTVLYVDAPTSKALLKLCTDDGGALRSATSRGAAGGCGAASAKGRRHPAPGVPLPAVRWRVFP